MLVKIRLETATDIANFVLATSTVKSPVYLTDRACLRVDGKSFLGICHAREFANLWCECEEDIHTKIKPFVVLED